MNKKLLVAGILSGIAISALEYLVFGIAMKPVFEEYATKGVMEMTGKPFGFIHYALQMLLGLPVVYLYSLVSAQRKRSAGLVIFTGLLAGIFCLSVTSALYTFYNLGTLIPVVISMEKIAECIVCCAIASLVYRKQQKI